MSSLLGIDIGTTATKVSLADVDGRVLAERAASCQVDSPHPGWAQVDAAQWWDNVCALVPQVLDAGGRPGADVVAVGVAGMVPTVICLDSLGRPLGPSIQQNDARAVAEIEEMTASFDPDGIVARTGSSITSQSVGPKLRWLQNHEPGVLGETARICGSYDWIVTLLTGSATTEANWALESGMWDLGAEDWADDVLAHAGVSRSWLAPHAWSHDIVGTVTAEAAAASGIPQGTPVTAGAADHIASAFSAGVVDEGDLLVKLGGAGDIMLSVDEPVIDRRVFLDHHLRPGAWMLNGCMASSGSVLRWFQRELAAGTPFETLDTAAETIPAGSDGVVCLPYFLGEKSPINDPSARGAFVGLHLGHTQGHVYRAILEAIAFGFRHHLDVFTERGLPIRRVRVTNGGSRSRLWREIVADVLERPIESLIDHPGSGLGAAFVAGVSVGAVSWSDLGRFARVDEVITPREDTREAYQARYGEYRDLYPALADISHRLARAQGDDI